MELNLKSWLSILLIFWSLVSIEIISVLDFKLKRKLEKKITTQEILFGLYTFTVINLGWNAFFNAVFLHLKYGSNFSILFIYWELSSKIWMDLQLNCQSPLYKCVHKYTGYIPEKEKKEQKL